MTAPAASRCQTCGHRMGANRCGLADAVADALFWNHSDPRFVAKTLAPLGGDAPTFGGSRACVTAARIVRTDWAAIAGAQVLS